MVVEVRPPDPDYPKLRVYATHKCAREFDFRIARREKFSLLKMKKQNFAKRNSSKARKSPKTDGKFAQI